MPVLAHTTLRGLHTCTFSTARARQTSSPSPLPLPPRRRPSRAGPRRPISPFFLPALTETTDPLGQSHPSAPWRRMGDVGLQGRTLTTQRHGPKPEGALLAFSPCVGDQLGGGKGGPCRETPKLAKLAKLSSLLASTRLRRQPALPCDDLTSTTVSRGGELVWHPTTMLPASTSQNRRAGRMLANLRSPGLSSLALSCVRFRSSVCGLSGRPPPGEPVHPLLWPWS